MLCLHHIDADGWCSGAIVNKYDNSGVKKFHPMDYKDPLPLDKIEPNELVYIVDFSLQAEQWSELLEITKNVIWIDHHKTAMENPEFPHHLKGYRINGIAGAALTWKYFMEDAMPPLAVRLVADYDVWTFAYGDETRYFQQGMYAQKGRNKPNSELWENLLSEDSFEYVRKIVDEGKIIHKYNTIQDESSVKHEAILIWYRGMRLYTLCNRRRTSMVFDSIDKRQYDGLAVFFFIAKEQKWKISFYTPHDHIDMTPLAKELGGGGHRNACGCEVKELPFDFTNLVNLE